MNEWFSWQAILALLLGGAYGAIFGAIPGLTATLAVALFIPLAFFLDPGVALPAIIAISSVAIFAGDVGSAVVKVPGTPASAAYVDPLYRVSQRKTPLFGLGISAMGSAFGGILGTVLLMVAAPLLSQIARQFTSFEYVWLAILGLCAGIFASQGSKLKSTVSLLLGLFFAQIGIDPTLGYARFNVGIPELLGGLNYIVVMIGLFGFSEVLGALGESQSSRPSAALSSSKATNWFFKQPLLLLLSKWWVSLRSALIGLFVGFLPGAGADIGAWVSTSVQQLGKKPSVAGTEAEEEALILAGSTSNNASVVSAWIPALTLGLPGDTVTAIVLGIFMMKGIQPGPMLFEQSPALIQSLFATFLIANLLLLPFYGFLVARLAQRLLQIPKTWLMSIIGAICVAGAFAINRNPYDIWLMAGMGYLALFLKRNGFPLAQIVLGMVLGPILEQQFMVSVAKVNWDAGAFFERPIALLFMALTLLIVIAGIKVQSQSSPSSKPEDLPEEVPPE